MLSFSRHDARWLSETIGAIYSAHNIPELTQHCLCAFDRKFALHSYAFEELSAGGSAYTPHEVRCSTPPPSDYAVHFHDNPFCWAITARRPPPVLHMRRAACASRWRFTDHYNGIARPMGWNDQLLVVASSGSSFVSVGLHRDTSFTDREHTLTVLLQPHIAAAWRRVECRHRPDAGKPLPDIELTAHFRPTNLSPLHAQVLRHYFPQWRGFGELPAVLCDWIAESVTEISAGALSRPLRAFVTESARGRLLARCFPRRDRSVHLRIVEVLHSPSYFEVQRHGLTSRECEVLHWIARGKRDAEIATIISAAPKTVGKHVENLLRKLQAESRGAAVSIARAYIAGHKES